MYKSLKNALLLLIMLTVITGVFYPLVITGIAQLIFPRQANGSLIVRDGQVVGSSLLAQNFTRPEYFHPRPSAAGQDGYDAAGSAATNLGPTSQKLMDSLKKTADDYRQENNLSDEVVLPSDAVTSSGSGLDPEISLSNAYMQIARVAEARGVSTDKIRNIVDEYADSSILGIPGEERVNVLLLNLSLDDMNK
ncbi:potassium-transporting ATPase subunit KdpC [Pectinatus frisingensis]|jgi:K+-transporting ATPase ATPase C chain|uniref:potassium-transporting ATPase subunit KdpC n=1 Tax=Pectinatus frisingensis TaxID=865 RepID=UPI0015F4F922|nr:potassium-transporting ATPase subunit KdpC [Pectinatus frisingensis]